MARAGGDVMSKPRTSHRLAFEYASQEGTPLALAQRAVATLSEQEARDIAVESVMRAIGDLRRSDRRGAERGHLALDRIRADADLRDRLRREVAARGRELQRAVDALEIPLEVAVAEVEALNAKHRDDWHIPQLEVVETVWWEVDGQPWHGSNLRHRYVADIQKRREAVRNTYGFAAQREQDRRDRRAAAGFDRVGSWEDDLATVIALRNALTVDITPDLLETEFHTTDGRLVTWGDASVEEHRGRVLAQTRLAAGTMEDAQRHAEIADYLERIGASSLSAAERQFSADREPVAVMS